MEKYSGKAVSNVRTVVQWCFLVWVICIGIRFGIFIHSLQSGAAIPEVSRPPGVEGFLPIGALTSLKYWLFTGRIHPVHPAALVIFLTILLMSLLAKKSFCSWLCPVGTISEGTHKLGGMLFGRNFRIWPWLDFVLRGLKYLLLLFFLKFIFWDMPKDALGAFLDAPYWAVSDVKMLNFFTHMSGTTMAVLAFLTVLSLLFKNFWCRYLCPYGALLGLLSMVSPFKIRRNAERCTNCRRCTAVCPSALEVHCSAAISSPECTGCLTCVANCPEANALSMRPSWWRMPLPVWGYPAVVVLVFAAGIGVGMVTGHWNSSLSYKDYQRLLPLMPYLDH